MLNTLLNHSGREVSDQQHRKEIFMQKSTLCECSTQCNFRIFIISLDFFLYLTWYLTLFQCSLYTSTHWCAEYDSIIHMKEDSRFYFCSFKIFLSKWYLHNNEKSPNLLHTKNGCHICCVCVFTNFMCSVSRSSHSFRKSSLHVLPNETFKWNKLENEHKVKKKKSKKKYNTIAKKTKQEATQLK